MCKLKNALDRHEKNTYMRIKLFIFLTIYFPLFLSSCSTYKFLENSFIIKEDNIIHNLDHKISLQITSNFHDLLLKDLSPSRKKKISQRSTNLLNKLGYNIDNYSVLYANTKTKDFCLYILVNNSGISKEGNEKLIDLTHFDKEKKDQLKWLSKNTPVNNKSVYQVVIPINEKIFNEKYVSVIYTTTPQKFKAYANVIEENNLFLISVMKEGFFPLKYPATCIHGGKTELLSFIIPKEIQELNEYTILKVYSDSTFKSLEAYTLIPPKATINSIHLCNQNYFIQHVDLKGNILFTENIYRK